MRERLVYIADAETVPDTGVWVKNINIVDPISQIDLIFEMKTGATSCKDHEIHDDVSKIEVIDGATVLHGLSMIEEQALNCFEKRKFPWFDFDCGAAKTVREGAMICFGRNSRDQQMYFNPKNYKNPQLRVTYAFTLSATLGFATGFGKITAIAHVIEDVQGAYSGFLMSKEVFTYTSVASAHKYIDMPTDYPYRLVMIKALLSTYGFETLVDHVRLSADQDKFVKLDMRGRDLFMMNSAEYDPLVQLKTLLIKTNGTALLDLYYPREISAVADATKLIAAPVVYSHEKVTMDVFKATAGQTKFTDAGSKAVRLTIEGWQPHGCVVVPMGDMADPTQWWDVTKYGSVILDILDLAVGGCADAIVTQQLHP